MELLIVIAIIGVLASIVLVVMNQARGDAKYAKAQQDLRTLRTAMELLLDDTGKWPNGCIPDQTDNPEVLLDNSAAGLVEAPPVGSVGVGCQWTAQEVASWDGPYVRESKLIDPWGNPYQFDPDYHCEIARSVGGIPSLGCDGVDDIVAALNSHGPNGVQQDGSSDYDSDNVVHILSR